MNFKNGNSGKNSGYKRRRFFLISFVLCFFIPAAIATSITRNLTNQPLAKGVFLVADPHMEGRYFPNSVVLLLEFDHKGALGVIVNKPTDIPLSEAMPDLKEFENMNGNMYIGGPVAEHIPLMLLRTEKKPVKSIKHIFDGIYWVTKHEDVIGVVRSMKPKDMIRIYAGYAGWYPGQLESEVARGGWVVLKADPYTVFDKNPDTVWDDLISGKSGLSVKNRQEPKSRHL